MQGNQLLDSSKLDKVEHLQLTLDHRFETGLSEFDLIAYRELVERIQIAFREKKALSVFYDIQEYLDAVIE